MRIQSFAAPLLFGLGLAACKNAPGACIEHNKPVGLVTEPYDTCKEVKEKDCTNDASQASPPTFTKGQRCPSLGYICFNTMGNGTEDGWYSKPMSGSFSGPCGLHGVERR